MKISPLIPGGFQSVHCKLSQDLIGGDVSAPLASPAALQQIAGQKLYISPNVLWVYSDFPRELTSGKFGVLFTWASRVGIHIRATTMVANKDFNFRMILFLASLKRDGTKKSPLPGVRSGDLSGA